MTTTFRKHDPLFLLSAIQTFALTVPSLILCFLGMLDQDAMLPIFFGPEDFALLTTPGLTKNLFELSLNAIAWYSIGYYRIYQGGAHQHPLLVLLGGSGKTVAAILFARNYLRGEASLLMLLAASVPDVLLGLYMIHVWVNQLGCSMIPLRDTKDE
ncbi:expressed unknown protein [Seminavis robusta]|uniref:Uncharacterized protein n=1 Tax=Seminavis robusta TaxID=568900 RepID=A0A9N8DZY9_9STRA|nr:expressed unknown protein [Seminavis robusta]|eukprot:Sro488_g153080.1 n/a (156) ;mRNA; r:27407-27874